LRKRRDEADRIVREAQKKKADEEASAESLRRDIGETDPVRELAETDALIVTVRAERDGIQARMRAAENRERILQGRHETIVGQITDFSNGLQESEEEAHAAAVAAGFPDFSAVRNQVKGEQWLIHAGREIDSYDKKVASLIERTNVLSSQLSGKHKPDISELEFQEKAAEDAEKSIEAEYIRALRDLQDFQKLGERYEELQRQRKVISRESAGLVRLSRDLSGDNEKRVSFKSFVLGMYLSLVSAYASKRFSQMSDGRYRLSVRTETEDRRSQAGLELDVLDAATGIKRPVGTLSGGEKFMASISLALGLADAIQERSGGIELEAVFIDEGFGALDDQALDNAISILDEIRGTRMVGVISHVGELKSRIPVQIEVTKGSRGSHISVQV
jgi:exonuclease SbcC